VDQAKIAAAEVALAQTGAQIAAGVTQVWDLPAGVGRTVVLVGSLTAARVTSLSAGGQVLADVEALATDRGVTVAVPDAAAMVAIGCLGLVVQGATVGSPSQGAVTQLVAPAGATVATGWQVGDLLTQLGPSTLLGRGAVVRCAAPLRAVRGGQQTAQAMTPAADVAASQQAVETWLPAATEVVALLLDRLDPQAPEADLAVAATGSQLLTPPRRVADGNRVVVLYDIGARDPKAAHLSVSVSSQAAWRLHGVAGLPGRAAEWEQRLQGNLARVLVPDGPLSAGGAVTVELRGGQA
jgi:hypothetical protein